jgi:hypothetical protein
LITLAKVVSAILPGTRLDGGRSFSAGLLQLEQILTQFRDAHSSSLDASLKGHFDSAITSIVQLKAHMEGWTSSSWSVAVLVQLGLLEASVTHHFSGNQMELKSRALRGRHHLNRLIATDSVARKKWRAAFGEGETACESLAATHLLWHGVWAFKCNGSKQRTDLIFPDQINFDDDASQSGAGLVLTEWKLCKSGDKPEDKFAEAQKQA